MGAVDLDKEFNQLIVENLECQNDFEMLVCGLSLSTDAQDHLMLKSVACKLSVARTSDELRRALETYCESVDLSDRKCSFHAAIKDY